MLSRIAVAGAVLSVGLVASVALGAPPRGGAKGGERGPSPGGNWSERSHSSPQRGPQGGQFGNQGGSRQREGNERGEGGRQNEGPATSNRNSNESSGAKGAAATTRNNPAASGAQGAAAGAAAANRNNPKATGAQGAAAGAAAANRNNPKATGAEGAAAGAAAANRNAPKATGAQGAAAGAAAANRNNPQFSGAQGAAAGAAAANRNNPQYSGAAGAAAGYAAVRNSAYHPNMYGAGWYGDHPGAWTAPGLAAGALWVPATWNSVASHMGYGTAAPISYDYGVNVTAQNGNVMVGDQNVGTVAEYSQQAADIAQTGADAQTSDDDQWLPLGVFAMVRDENQHPHLIVQMAVNKNGIIRGNYTDEVTDHTLPIHGAVDKDTQRAAWTVGDNPNTVMEAGINDLTGSEASALIHKKGKSEHWLLVRIEHPTDATQESGGGAEK